MMGWEGRFEPPQVMGRSVMLMPLQDIVPEDRLLLVVRLESGTELPFIVTAREGQVDQQVNVFLNPEAPEAMRAALADAHAREQTLTEENQRYKAEETSVDHALATLMARGAVKQTPFRHTRTWRIKDEGANIEVQSFTGVGKAAVVFNMKNLDPAKPWKLLEARVSSASTGEARPFALRGAQDEIPPGGSGAIAIIADESAFTSKSGTDQLVLELFRSDGLQQVVVVLEWKSERE